jgi:hypothetical protein
MEDINNHDIELVKHLREKPEMTHPVLERAALEVYQSF